MVENKVHEAQGALQGCNNCLAGYIEDYHHSDGNGALGFAVLAYLEYNVCSPFTASNILGTQLMEER